MGFFNNNTAVIKELALIHQKLDLLLGKNVETRETESSTTAIPEGIKNLLNRKKRKSKRSREPKLEAGSDAYKAHKVLQAYGEPMHVELIASEFDITKGMVSIINLSSALNSYVRRGKIFTRTAPYTYGLVEWQQK